MKNQNSLIILDRDGILNKLLVLPNGETDSPMNIFEVSVFHWVSDALKELNSLGFGLAVATNQPAAAKGKISLKNLYNIHDHIIQQAQSSGAKILSLHICIHRKEDLCECRKPKSGLLQEAFDTHPQFNLENSWMVGDRATDIIAGHNFKLQTAWLGTPSQEDENLLRQHNIIPSFKGTDLRDFVYFLK